MNFSDLASLTKLSSLVQILAVALIFLGGALQATRFLLDKKINSLKERQSQVDRATADSTILELRTKVSDEDERIQKQSEVVEEQDHKIDSQAKVVDAQQQAIQKAEARGLPRTIPDEVYAKLRDQLGRHAGDSVEIACVLGDAEGMAFATRFASLFREAGWVVVGGGVTRAVFDNPVQGMKIALRNSSPTPKAQYLHDVLGSAGFESDFAIFPGEQYSIIIGSRE
jgi:hypothetical protein